MRKRRAARALAPRLWGRNRLRRLCRSFPRLFLRSRVEVQVPSFEELRVKVLKARQLVALRAPARNVAHLRDTAPAGRVAASQLNAHPLGCRTAIELLELGGGGMNRSRGRRRRRRPSWQTWVCAKANFNDCFSPTCARSEPEPGQGKKESKRKGRSGNRTRDLLHPKQESYL